MTKYQFKECRKKQGLTQKQVAEQLNMSVSNYSKIEREETDVALSVFLKMASLFQVSIIELVGEDHDIRPLTPLELILRGEELISRAHRMLYQEGLRLKSEGKIESPEEHYFRSRFDLGIQKKIKQGYTLETKGKPKKDD